MRRNFHLTHKHAHQALPALMKSPTDASKLLTGQAASEAWGSSATSTRPNTMPSQSTEEGPAPWLNPALWASVQASFRPLEVTLMAPISEAELSAFLKSTGVSSPGTDRIQYDVLRFMLYHSSLVHLKLAPMLLRFLNRLLEAKQIPKTMKACLLTFIHKSGDPLQYSNYRGISLLSCLFKIVTGSLNGRLQTMLHTHTGFDTNQGANRKGVHSAHKATVLMNIIADARMHDKPLHIVYADIKGAFPSVPCQAFTDALTTLGLGCLVPF